VEFEVGVAPLTCTVPHWELVANRTFLEVSKQDIAVFFFQSTRGRKLVQGQAAVVVAGENAGLVPFLLPPLQVFRCHLVLSFVKY
jgi:hypothetical protein